MMRRPIATAALRLLAVVQPCGAQSPPAASVVPTAQQSKATTRCTTQRLKHSRSRTSTTTLNRITAPSATDDGVVAQDSRQSRAKQ